MRAVSSFIGEKAEIIDAGGANLVHRLDHVAVLRASVALDEDGLVQAVGEQVLYLAGDVIEGDLVVPRK